MVGGEPGNPKSRFQYSQRPESKNRNIQQLTMDGKVWDGGMGYGWMQWDLTVMIVWDELRSDDVG